MKIGQANISFHLHPFGITFKRKPMRMASSETPDQLYSDVVTLIVKTNEGGYFDPSMMDDGRMKLNPLMLAGEGRKASGETMMGIDRVNGADLKKNNPQAWNDFWKIMDDANAKKNWKWNYIPKDKFAELLNLEIQFMHPSYIRMKKKYLSPNAEKLVDSDKRLTYHFVYGTWNGEGFFKKFANAINKAVQSGINDLDELSDVAIDSRINGGNKLIAKGGQHIKELFKTLS